MSSVKERYKKSFYFYGFGFRYAEGITDENELIKGINIYTFGRQMLTIALADTDWVDSNGKPYKCKVDDKVLYIMKLAIGFL